MVGLDNISALTIAHKALESNNLLRRLFVDYDKKAEQFKGALKAVMNKNKCTVVDAVYHILKKADKNKEFTDQENLQIWILSAMADIIKEKHHENPL